MFWTVTLSILQGCGEAAKLFFLTLLFALPLGLVVAFGSMNKWAPFRFLLRGKSAPGGTLRALAAFRPISALTNLIVWVIRGTPLILQLIIIFYGPGMWFKANPWNAFSDGRMFACTLAFVINYACYFSVIYRGGIEGVPAGQREAGQVLGLTRSQIFFQVTLLQMVKRIVPPMSNEVITLVKDTSLSRIIALQEIIWAGQAFLKGTQGISGAIWPLFFTGIYYLIFSGLLTLALGKLEKKLDYFKA